MLYIFEGPDAVGKTVLANMLIEHLDSNYHSFDGCDAEIGTLGKTVYDIHHSNFKICAESVQMMHVATHINALKLHIIPLLDTGKTVILNRCYWSTFVYGKVYDAPEKFLQDVIKLELPYWQNYLDDATLFLITRPEPFDKHDDAKSLKHWQQIHDLYDHVFNGNEWDNLNRLRVENVGDLSDTFNMIETFVKDTGNGIQKS